MGSVTLLPGRMPDDLPEIRLSDRQLDAIVDDGVRAIIRANTPPRLFLRSGEVVAVRRDEEGRPRVEMLGEVPIVDRLAECARWIRSGKKGVRIESGPGRALAGVVLSRLKRSDGSLPTLRGVIESPIMREDGCVLASEGYDPATALYFAPAAGFVLPPIPAAPTREEIAAAVQVVDELLIDFPVGSDGDYATVWAALLSVVLRALIDGAVPLILIDAPAPGTGKSLLAKAIVVVATGRDGGMMPAPGDRDDAEWRKRITAGLLDGHAITVIDNVEQPIGSPSLATVLTADSWTDRALGRSENLTLPARTVWLATGNNIRLRGDLPRRAIWCRLDAKVARPWTRDGFQHADLIAVARERRPAILGAIYTLATAWIAAGRPGPEETVPPLGSFESFRHVVGGVLRVAGIRGFLENLSALYEAVDDDGPAWAALLLAWRDRYGEAAIPTARLLQDAQAETPDGRALREVLPGELAEALAHKAAASKRIGHALKRKAETRYVVDDEGRTLRLVRAQDDSHAKVARWVVKS